MAIRMSTGLRNALLDADSFREIFDGGFLHIYEGAIPSDPDAEVTGTLLATIYSDGEAAGLSFAATAANGVIQKDAGETWNNSENGNIASGTAQYFVFTASAENDGTDLGASTTAPRFIGTIGIAGADMNMTSTALTLGQTQAVDAFNVAFPVMA